MNRNQVTLLNPWRVGQSSQLSFRSSDHSSPPRPWIHSAGAKSGDYKNRHERSSSPQENQKHLKSEIDPSYTISVLKEKNITLMQLSFVFLFLEWRHAKLILHYSPLQCFSWTLNHYDRLEYLCFILDVLRCEDYNYNSESWSLEEPLVKGAGIDIAGENVPGLLQMCDIEASS